MIRKKGPVLKHWGRKLAHGISKSELGSWSPENLYDILRLSECTGLPFPVCLCTELFKNLARALFALSYKQPKSCKALGSIFKAPRPLCLPSSTSGTRRRTSEDQARHLGWEVSWGAVTLLAAFSACSLFDLMVLQLLCTPFQLRSAGLERAQRRKLSLTWCVELT